MTNIKLWGYHDEYRIGMSENRHVRWFGKCNIEQYLTAILTYGNPDNSSRQWIRERMGETMNDQELLLLTLTDYKYILCRDDKTGNILKAVRLSDNTVIKYVGDLHE
jgi:hypothetical protein